MLTVARHTTQARTHPQKKQMRNLNEKLGAEISLIPCYSYLYLGTWNK